MCSSTTLHKWSIGYGVPTPRAPPVKIDLSEESVAHNSDLLRNSGLDMESLLMVANQYSTLNFGSEFRPIDELEKILGKHPNFEFFSGVLRNGMDYRFAEELPVCLAGHTRELLNR
jgi:hypothetical protein